jgi:hypothetical protein
MTFGWLLVALVVYLSVIASPPEVHHFSGGDKLMHFLAYASVMLWFGLIFLPGRTYLILGFGFIMMGFALEIIGRDRLQIDGGPGHALKYPRRSTGGVAGENAPISAPR